MRILAIAASLLLLSCGKVAEPEFRRIDNFGVKKLGIAETVIGFDVVYHNPNNFGVQVKETVLDVYLDSALIGKFHQLNVVDVTDNKEFSIPLEGSVSLQKAIQLNLPAMVGRDVLVRAVGETRVGKAGVFVTKDIKYSGTHRIDADLLKNPASAGF